jgi:hypothetical protein
MVLNFMTTPTSRSAYFAHTLQINIFSKTRKMTYYTPRMINMFGRNKLIVPSRFKQNGQGKIVKRCG